MLKHATVISFKIKKTAVNLVINIGVIFLLAQVQTGYIHGGLGEKDLSE